jgi:hypothetical protein
MLNHYSNTSADGVTHRDRFNYILDQYNPTPGDKTFFFFKLSFFLNVFTGFITRDQGEQVFNRLNKYNR